VLRLHAHHILGGGLLGGVSVSVTLKKHAHTAFARRVAYIDGNYNILGQASTIYRRTVRSGMQGHKQHLNAAA
jgi:hypothetical protein